MTFFYILQHYPDAWVTKVVTADDGKEATPAEEPPKVEEQAPLRSLGDLQDASTATWNEEQLMRLKTAGDIPVVFFPGSAKVQGAYLEVRSHEFAFLGKGLRIFLNTFFRMWEYLRYLQSTTSCVF